MKLDRINGRGKYAVIKLRAQLSPAPCNLVPDAIDSLEVTNRGASQLLVRKDALEFGEPGSSNEFFVLMLKDRFASKAIWAYAQAVKEHAASCDGAEKDGWLEYAHDIERLWDRGVIMRGRKLPD